MFDVSKIRTQFPILNQKVNGKDLIYFDNAASSQKPQSVINSLSYYYSNDNANIHRGVHSVIEPAMYNCIISFGPNIEMLDEAQQLHENKIG